MTLPTPLTRPPATLSSEQAETPPAKKKIVVHPDQITQRDYRPWSQSSLEDVLFRFVLVSTIIVATGVGLLALALGVILD